MAALAALASLSACVQTPQVGSSSIPWRAALHAAVAATDPGLARAPEVFSASGVATWDGTRTVDGLWVGHPAADRSRPVRVVNPGTGAEVDAMLYRLEPARANVGDVVTVSSETARALGLEPGQPTTLSLFALRPQGAVSARQRRATETIAESELVSHVARMEPNQVLHLVAAAMRGMGYDTVFEPGENAEALPEIRAVPRPDEGLQSPAIRVLVRPGDMEPMSKRELAERQALLTRSGDSGLVVSVAGFEDGSIAGLDPGGARLEMVDLQGLLDIWQTHYASLSEPDRALLRLQPVWFLADGEAEDTAGGPPPDTAVAPQQAGPAPQPGAPGRWQIAR